VYKLAKNRHVLPSRRFDFSHTINSVTYMRQNKCFLVIFGFAAIFLTTSPHQIRASEERTISADKAWKWFTERKDTENKRWSVYSEELEERPGYEEWLTAWREYTMNIQTVAESFSTQEGLVPTPETIATAEESLTQARLRLQEAWRKWKTTN
jgi:hypothetical protein